MILRDYQARAIDEARAEYRAGRRAVVLVSPTGSGKTVIGAFVARSHLARRPGPAAAVLVIAPRIELVDQWAATMHSIGLRVTTDVDKADQLGLDGTPQVVVATIQGITASKRAPVVTFIVADEGHHYVSEKWHAALQPSLQRGAMVMGLTATPERGDGTGLRELFDSIVVVSSIRELTDMGHLVPCDVVDPKCPPQQKGDGTLTLAGDPVSVYLDHGMGPDGLPRRAIFFCHRIDQARALQKALVERGVPAESIDSQLSTEERKNRIARFRAGTVRAMVNVDILTEGFDDPSVEVVVLATRIGTIGGYIQRVGRALRLSPSTGKTRALLIDLGGSVALHGRPEEDREYSLDGMAIRRLTKRPPMCGNCGAKLRAKDLQARRCLTCGASMGAGTSVLVDPGTFRLTSPSAHRLGKPIESLIRALLLAAEKGYRQGWASHRFRATHGRWPTRREMDLAVEELNGVQA